MLLIQSQVIPLGSDFGLLFRSIEISLRKPSLVMRHQ